MKKAKFIVLEGIDGSGKSTQAEMMSSYFKKLGKRVYLTQEPGGTPLGNALRQMIKNNQFEMTALAELFLIQAARVQHVSEKLIPAINQYDVVISDRFYHSSFAYQGGGRGLNWKVIHQLNALAIQGLQPDCVLIYDLAPEMALKRTQTRSGAASTTNDRFEGNSLAFYQQVRAAYGKIAEMSPLNEDGTGYKKIIAASGTAADIHQLSIDAVKEVLNL